ncbi:MAG: DUF1592 domain-containing protein [Phycisphaeraceae bacterium]
MKNSTCHVLMLLAAVAFWPANPARGADADLAAMDKAFGSDIQPLLKTFCYECHSGELPEADIDLTVYKSLADLRKHTKVWQKVGHMLDSGQMPPRKAKQLGDSEREKLRLWVRGFLLNEAKAHAGDPGPIVLRRLNNAEYTYTLRDLTGIPSLDPAREFPGDGAAGEGFTNTGNALVMSPTLVTKYLDAAKEVASHAVLLPDGMAFSSHKTRRDWTNEKLDAIRAFYQKYTDPRGGDRVNLQGIVFQTNEGGRLPLAKYLAASLEWRATRAGPLKTAPPEFALERNLSPKYLRTLQEALSDDKPSLLLAPIRARWRNTKPNDPAALNALIAEIEAWQKALSKFNSVGHIGKVGGPTRWLDPVNPLVTQQAIRFKLPAPQAGEVVFSLVASDAGDGGEGDVVLWQQPRLVAKGRPDVLLKDVRALSAQVARRRAELFARTAAYLDAASEIASVEGQVDHEATAAQRKLEVPTLRAWLDYLGVASAGPVKIEGHYQAKIEKDSKYDFVKGWGSGQTPLLLANSSDQHVRVPGHMKPHGVAMHPSPTLRAAVGWQAPIDATLEIEGLVVHAHPECGNGVTWYLELRRGSTRQRIATGIAQGANQSKVGPFEKITVNKGDVISLLVGPRDGNHSCDMTAIDFTLTTDKSPDKDALVWDLAKDVSPNILAGNPHADSRGKEGVWHFYTEPDKDVATGPAIPAGSLLSRWLSAKGAEKDALARGVQKLLADGPPKDDAHPDAQLYRQLVSVDGPLLGVILRAADEKKIEPKPDAPAVKSEWGLDASHFGRRPDGSDIDANSLAVQAPKVIEIRVPAELAVGSEFVSNVVIDGKGDEKGGGSVQVQVVAGKVSGAAGLVPAGATVSQANVDWARSAKTVSFSSPILISDDKATRDRIEAQFDAFRDLFPAALCYTRIVPVDEVVTLTLYYREDGNLSRLMLDDAQSARLDRMWSELFYISQDALILVDALEQIIQFATQDSDPSVLLPLRKPYADRAEAYRKQLVDTQPAHIDALLAFAAKAYRRPLSNEEASDLRSLYAKLRAQEIPHEEAFRLTLARVLVSPAFLYRAEKAPAGVKQGPVEDFDLATRLSYFLWSSLPDEELLAAAASGKLRETDTLLAQMRRMMKDPRSRRLAIEFACQWLHVRDFDQLDEKSERHFPAFSALRADMYEETIRFFADLFQNGGSVLDILDADHTFLNERLAKHYNIPNVKGDDWRRVEGVKQRGRGGILAQATVLAKQSGASRTSPILRGNWVSEVLLGERLPRPPKDVPQLPDDPDAFKGLTVRQLTEKHSSDPRCAVCHERIDPFGFSLEAYDTIGARREKDAMGQAIDTKARTKDGIELEGLDGLRKYLLTTRRDAFVGQFNRKLLGYALGRSVQLSDEPLLEEIMSELKAKGYRMQLVFEAIVKSKQFREIRGRDAAYDEE